MILEGQGQARLHLKFNDPWSHEWGPVQVDPDKIPELLARHAFHHRGDAKLYLVVLRKMFVQHLHGGACRGCSPLRFVSLIALKQHLFRRRREIGRPLDWILAFRRPSGEGDDV